MELEPVEENQQEAGNEGSAQAQPNQDKDQDSEK
jgi:hypothetical protein